MQQIQRWQRGDRAAGEALWQSVYRELRDIAGRQFARERSNHTLQPTALVGEALERLYRLDRIEWQDRAHFIAMGARIMREILIDHARRRGAGKRDFGQRVTLTGGALADGGAPLELLDLDEALSALAEFDPQKAKLVELRFFGGLSSEEAAAVLDVSATTAKRQWQAARAWLYRRLSRGPLGGQTG
ncbi:MAG: ECF-type sigma factor [Pseudomonadota bacterium]